MKTECILKNNSRKHFWWMLGTLMLLIMVRYALQIDIPRVVLLAVIGTIALLGDRDEIVAMCICCIPLHETVDFFYALVLCTGIYILKFYRHLRISSNVLLVLCIIIWELFHCFLTSFSVVDYLGAMIPFIVLAVLMDSDAEAFDYTFIVRALAWATFGASLVMFIRVLFFSDFNFSLAIAGLQRMGSDRYSNVHDAAVAGGQINPNSLGVITVLVSSALMQLRARKVGKKSDMILMCTLLVLAALGTSRTYLACLALMSLLLVFSEKGGWKKKLQLTMVLLLAIISVVVAMRVLFPDTFQYFISRFQVDDLTTGRDNLMLQYNRFILENPRVLLFGIGLQDYGNRLIHFYRVAANTPHNSIQELIIAWGIPGLFLFVTLFFNMYRTSSKKNRNQSLINWIPLIIILFKSIAGQLLTSSYTMLALLFAYLSLCTDMSPKDDQCIFTRPQVSPGGSGKNIKNL